MNIDDTKKLIEQLKGIQAKFFRTFGVTDIITNSKIFEILIADTLQHTLIPGHSGSRDAKDEEGNEFEYKHYKETSSNHTWTFNDFSDTTIEKLKHTKSVVFAHIQDVDVSFPVFDWYYEVPGIIVSQYLEEATTRITNSRKMINVGPRQIEVNMGYKKIFTEGICTGVYSALIREIVDVILKIEKEVGTSGILTSNKFWEVLVALQLGHNVQSEQSKHDATDEFGNMFEYKVSKSTTWSFQDISDVVLNKYLNDKSIVLAVVDKNEFIIKKIYEADANKIVNLLKSKLIEKELRYTNSGRLVRRKQISLSLRNIIGIGAKEIYSSN